MTAFDIYINGRKICTAGLPGTGVVTSTITWVRGTNEKEIEDLFFHAGGLFSKTHTNTFVDWAHRELKTGDEVRIVITEKEKASKPKKQRKDPETFRKKRKLAYLKQLAKELGFELSKKGNV